jgi:KDO2-lipid IV(A) lauroyltransferase
MKVLYLLSTISYVIVYYIIGYRKKVVFDNLNMAFPEKSDKELQLISKKFFRHFTDIFVESIKAFSISEKEITARYTIKNPELINDIAKKKKSIVLVGSHYANWEWLISIPLNLDIRVLGAYSKLKNKYYEHVLKKSRTKFGIIGYKTSDIIKNIHTDTLKGVQGMYVLLSDQSPKLRKTHYWAKFMGIKVPVHTGAEMLSKKFDLAFVNYKTTKIKRGYYQIEFELISETPKEVENYELTDQYLKITETYIREQPELYLWSHKRFKHKDKVPAKFL